MHLIDLPFKPTIYCSNLSIFNNQRFLLTYKSVLPSVLKKHRGNCQSMVVCGLVVILGDGKQNGMF